ncbi:MAG TPA: methyltransferase domain-containing protein [Jatrophihabitantaceae bacterium]|nr:methyltransferase domain-containing protein [Jatrophihabitantaceae bacterium]
MHAGALEPYELSLLTAGDLAIHTHDGRVLMLDVDRWLAAADAADDTVLQRCIGPTLDIGCGPGRLVAELTTRGIAALGLDIAGTAVELTKHRGAAAVLRSVFAQVPGEGRWPTVLLIDGNIGIGGDPRRLLERVRQLLAPRGHVIVETHADAEIDERLVVRFSRGGRPSGPPFAWAHVGRVRLLSAAAEIGYVEAESWSSGGRTFVSLLR